MQSTKPPRGHLGLRGSLESWPSREAERVGDDGPSSKQTNTRGMAWHTMWVRCYCVLSDRTDSLVEGQQPVGAGPSTCFLDRACFIAYRSSTHQPPNGTGDRCFLVPATTVTRQPASTNCSYGLLLPLQQPSPKVEGSSGRCATTTLREVYYTSDRRPTPSSSRIIPGAVP